MVPHILTIYWQRIKINSQLLKKQSGNTIFFFGEFFFDWIGNQQADDEYWQKLNPLSYFDRYDLPALHIAGWADIFIEATINTYHQAKASTQKPQHLVVAPWQHMPWPILPLQLLASNIRSYPPPARHPGPDDIACKAVWKTNSTHFELSSA